jgi:branched-chain amino acid transport system substrate-binding protein
VLELNRRPVAGVGRLAGQSTDRARPRRWLTDMKGLYAYAIGPGSFLAARMAAEDAGGSVLGRPIETLAAGNQNKADVGSGIARHWYDRDLVGMVAGHDNSPVAFGVEQVGRERNGIAVAIAVRTNGRRGWLPEYRENLPF